MVSFVPISGCLFRQGYQEILVVTAFIEAGRTVFASLNDVPGNVRDNKANAARHAENLRAVDRANILHE
jgi:hypothetical protein